MQGAGLRGGDGGWLWAQLPWLQHGLESPWGCSSWLWGGISGGASLGCCKTRAVKTLSAALLSFCEVRDVGTGTGILLAANGYRNEKQTISPK